MAEAAFSEDGKYYTAISADGRLKIWDTETNVLKQEYTPDLHLTSPPSCLQWITVSQTNGQKQRTNFSSAGDNETQCIALGTKTGNILVYSVAQAKVQTVFEKQSNEVTALDWNRKCGFFSCHKDNHVVEWDLQTGKVRHRYYVAVDSKSKQGNNISAIKIVPHKLNTPSKVNYLVTASWQVRLWRLHSGAAIIVKTLGHNASQTALLSLARSNDQCWLIEGSQNERLLSFWDVTLKEDHKPQVNGNPPNKKTRKKSLTNIPTETNASYNFVLEDAPRMVDVAMVEEDGVNVLWLAAATRSGVIHYYRRTLNVSQSKPLKPSVTLQASTAEATPLPLQCCHLDSAGDLLVAYLDGVVMNFETITPDLKSKTQILIRGSKDRSQTRSQVADEVTKVKSDRRSDRAQLIQPLGGVVGRKRPNPGSQLDVAMEARLANLKIDYSMNTPVNENLSKLLMQGLKSNDQSIIRLVLNHTKSKVASRTVAALSVEYIPALLEQLAQMASLNTNLCGHVVPWATALVRGHAATVMALAAAGHAHHANALLATLTHRRSQLCQLLNLKGRMELTLAQREAAYKHHEQMPVLHYNDDASSDEEPMEVMDEEAFDYDSWREASDDDEKNDDDKNDDDKDDDDNDDDRDRDVASSASSSYDE